MDKSFISGFEKIESDYGYFPTFHDDVIDKIEISSEGISFIIDMKTIPDGMSSYPKVKLTFLEVESFILEGEIFGCASIILDMEFEKNGDGIETQLCSSVGTAGIICSENIKIELV